MYNPLWYIDKQLDEMDRMAKSKTQKTPKDKWWEKDRDGKDLKYGDLVKVDLSHVKKKVDKLRYPFVQDERLIYLGEIRRMEGHCIVANKQGQVFWGYHTFNFVLLTDDEV